MMTFKQFLRLRFPPYIDEVFFTDDGVNGECLREGKWVKGRFDNGIRIDRATHLKSGEQHAHVYGRKGELIGVVNLDGTKSHGGDSFRLHKRDAKALSIRGFNVPKNNIIEWIIRGAVPGSILLLE
jgi:hypothetical protein